MVQFRRDGRHDRIEGMKNVGLAGLVLMFCLGCATGPPRPQPKPIQPVEVASGGDPMRCINITQHRYSYCIDGSGPTGGEAFGMALGAATNPNSDRVERRVSRNVAARQDWCADVRDANFMKCEILARREAQKPQAPTAEAKLSCAAAARERRNACIDKEQEQTKNFGACYFQESEYERWCLSGQNAGAR